MSLPHELHVGRFLASRTEEVQLLCGEVARGAGQGMLASQQVPRRMRRRAVSHNPKRLPRRLRAAHLSQRTKSGTEPGAAPGLRRPSRRWRRRPGNLLAEYNRRQRGPGAAAWLETHIWHAKRFHMTRAWGHALPRTPTDKCWRQTYRGLVRGCVAWDCSYLQVVAARGPRAALLATLNTLTDPSAGPGFRHGPGEGRVTVYTPGQCPGGAVGEVTYIWVPGSPEEEEEVWLWCHPGHYHQFTQLLIAAMQLETVGAEEVSKSEVDSVDRVDSRSEVDSVDTTATRDQVGVAKLQQKLVPPRLMRGGAFTVTLLENRVNRFSLRGPLSLTMLKHILPTVDEIDDTMAFSR